MLIIISQSFYLCQQNLVGYVCFFVQIFKFNICLFVYKNMAYFVKNIPGSMFIPSSRRYSGPRTRPSTAAKCLQNMF